MRLATRTFLWSFLAASLLLIGCFWTIQRFVLSAVRDSVRASLRENQLLIARIASQNEIRNSRVLQIVGENPALKAGWQLLNEGQGSDAARLTVEDQLREICDNLRFDLIWLSSPEGIPMAGIIREGNRLTGMNLAQMAPPKPGLLTQNGATFYVTSMPVNQGDENIGILSFGERFNPADFNTPIVLAHNGIVLQASIAGISEPLLAAAMARCGGAPECEMRLGGETYVSMRMDGMHLGNGYSLRSFSNLDSASQPVRARLKAVFLTASALGLLAALVLTTMLSRSIVRPISQMVSHLRECEKSGVLPQFDGRSASIREIRELMEAFSRASSAVRVSGERLHLAYVEFVGSLASALDARDHYTAGHSTRVSDFSCAIAAALNASDEELNEIQVGALLHDIGKIGIADGVLQKPGRLTAEERAMIEQHPSIGWRILAGVNGFRPYLAIVELHHENWDGSGYPRGLAGLDTPRTARIVHVADAYDAMTSDRPYRRGMTPEEAIRRLEENSGSQFDPDIVRVFVALWNAGEPAVGDSKRAMPDETSESASLARLAEAAGQIGAMTAVTR